MDDSNDLLPNFSTFVYDMDSLIIAYCRDNTDLAEEISKNLGLIGIPFEHVTNMPGEQPGTFARALLGQQDGNMSQVVSAHSTINLQSPFSSPINP